MARECKILIVDDDPELRRSLAAQLALHAEFAIAEAETASAALECIRHQSFDAILLDLSLPDMDGRELCRLIRRSKFPAPILMMTAASTEAETILGLNSGASDYITKPFHLDALLARLRAQLRQHEQSEDASFTIGRYTFRPSAKLLVDATQRKNIKLTGRQTDVLRYLYHARDRNISRDMLLQEVWGYSRDAETHTLEMTIYRLRRKIEIDPAHPELLVKTPDGYRLVL